MFFMIRNKKKELELENEFSQICHYSKKIVFVTVKDHIFFSVQSTSSSPISSPSSTQHSLSMYKRWVHGLSSGEEIINGFLKWFTCFICFIRFICYYWHRKQGITHYVKDIVQYRDILWDYFTHCTLRYLQLSMNLPFETKFVMQRILELPHRPSEPWISCGKNTASVSS